MDSYKNLLDIKEYCFECPHIDPEVIQPNNMSKARLIKCRYRNICENLSKHFEQSKAKGGGKRGNSKD